MRGTFANIRLRNLLVPGIEGGVTVHMPDGEQMLDLRIAMRYKQGRHAAGDPRRQASTAPAPRATGRPRARCCSA